MMNALQALHAVALRRRGSGDGSGSGKRKRSSEDGWRMAPVAAARVSAELSCIHTAPAPGETLLLQLAARMRVQGLQALESGSVRRHHCAWQCSNCICAICCVHTYSALHTCNPVCQLSCPMVAGRVVFNSYRPAYWDACAKSSARAHLQWRCCFGVWQPAAS